MKTLLLSFFISVAALASSPLENEVGPEVFVLRQNAHIIDFRYSIGEPIRLYVVGREEARFDPATARLTFRRIGNEPFTELSPDSGSGFYIKTNPKETHE